MYRTDLRPRDRSGAIVAVALIHGALLFAFLNISGKMPLPANESVVQLLIISLPKPPTPPPQQKLRPKPRESQGGAAAPNIRSEATPVVAPRPKIATPPLATIAAAPTPHQGAGSIQGASNLAGPGTGASGMGTGTGSGASGGGPGGGGVAVGASLIRGITGRDYPPGLQQRWPRGGAIYVRLRVEPNGRPSRCDVMRSFGDALTDQWTCALLMERSSFRPALDARGVPVAAWFGYKQVDIGG